jgi:hypothetical protein
VLRKGDIGQYAEQLADAQIDGILLKELDEEILTDEFGFKRFEAIKLMKYSNVRRTYYIL